MTQQIAAQRPYLDDAQLCQLMKAMQGLERYGARSEDPAAYRNGPIIAKPSLHAELFDAISDGTRLGFVRGMDRNEKIHERLLIGTAISVSPERIRSFGICVHSSTPSWFNNIEVSSSERSVQYVSIQEGEEPFTPLSYYVTGIAQQVYLVGCGEALYYPIVVEPNTIESAAIFAGAMTGVVLAKP